MSSFDLAISNGQVDLEMVNRLARLSELRRSWPPVVLWIGWTLD